MPVKTRDDFVRDVLDILRDKPETDVHRACESVKWLASRTVPTMKEMFEAFALQGLKAAVYDELRRNPLTDNAPPEQAKSVSSPARQVPTLAEQPIAPAEQAIATPSPIEGPPAQPEHTYVLDERASAVASPISYAPVRQGHAVQSPVVQSNNRTTPIAPPTAQPEQRTETRLGPKPQKSRWLLQYESAVVTDFAGGEVEWLGITRIQIRNYERFLEQGIESAQRKRSRLRVLRERIGSHTVGAAIELGLLEQADIDTLLEWPGLRKNKQVA